MEITAPADGGNIEIIEAAWPEKIRLRIVKDNKSDFYQWFYFRITGAQRANCRIRIENAGGAAYTDGWQNYRPVASYDRETWFRIPADYDGESLIMNFQPESDVVWVAYFAPYSLERHAEMIASAAQQPFTRIRSLGKTIDGQDIDMIETGAGGGTARKIWILARQHPGETMAQWWVEGFLGRLFDFDDPVSRVLMQQCKFYIVPNMNPDGSRRGHLRTNAEGINLNRAWNDPDERSCPEVYHVRRTMERIGVDFHMDIHGDEALPYVFLAGFEGIPTLRPEPLRLFNAFKEHYARISPDFQTEHGYPVDAPGTADLRKCTDWVAERFGVCAMTLEMPFKDNANLPDTVMGWSPDRCKALGRAALDALLAVLADIPVGSTAAAGSERSG